ncbi:MAG: hypothetical protein CMF31_08540 [Kordiimonas sp.]|nr:hypothetical protein [Kordiimonas sp.]|tara:strand:- start:4886 stop:5362 length:477 start_codon:yes stop_codon:yes gene_type:complete
MTKKIIITAISMVALGTTVAIADGHMKKKEAMRDMMSGHGGKAHHGAVMLHMYDRNEDGVVSADEFKQQHKKTFVAADDDGNAALDFEEFESFAEMQKAAHQRAMRQHKFKMMDSNGDGKVSADEFSAKMDKRFARMDRNDDGTLDKKDRKSLHKPKN